MKKVNYILASVLSVFLVISAPSGVVQAIDINDAKTEVKKESCKNVKDCDDDNAIGSVFRTVANILLFLVGAVAVIMLIIGGFRYVLSNGDSSITKGARDTILYALIGIVVAFLAYAGVNFIVTTLTTNST